MKLNDSGIRRAWPRSLHNRQQARQPDRKASPPRWFRLSNGRQVNLADWKVVLFMQGHCPYCHQFDPVLKQLAQQYGFFRFSLHPWMVRGGYRLSGGIAGATGRDADLLPEYPGGHTDHLPRSTSTRLRHYRFYRGQRMPPVLSARMDTVLQMYGGKKGAK